MNGLIKQSKLDGVNTLASLGVALFSLAAAFYAFAGLGGIA